MTRLFEYSDQVTPALTQAVEIRHTDMGRGLFAVRPYPEQAVIGEIRGELIHSRTYGSSYAFELDEGVMLEPFEPFRYVNHCCEPNCEFDVIDDPDCLAEGFVPGKRLYLIALRNIEAGEEFSIDYNWSAQNAIRCLCHAVHCRGWVVAEDELHRITED